MNILSILGSGPLVALAGHAITAGLTFALAKGYITADAMQGVITVGGLILNAAASAGRSTNTAAARKIVASDVVAVPRGQVPGAASEPTIWGKSP